MNKIPRFQCKFERHFNEIRTMRSNGGPEAVVMRNLDNKNFRQFVWLPGAM